MIELRDCRASFPSRATTGGTTPCGHTGCIRKGAPLFGCLHGTFSAVRVTRAFPVASGYVQHHRRPFLARARAVPSPFRHRGICVRTTALAASVVGPADG